MSSTQTRPRRGIARTGVGCTVPSISVIDPLSRPATLANRNVRMWRLTHAPPRVNMGYPLSSTSGGSLMANHLTPGELADQLRMNQQEVIGRCVQMGIPI